MISKESSVVLTEDNWSLQWDSIGSVGQQGV